MKLFFWLMFLKNIVFVLREKEDFTAELQYVAMTHYLNVFY